MTSQGRLWLHVPVGLATVAGVWLHPVLGAIMCFTFMGYQWIEEWRIKDFSYLDIAGYSWGLFGGMMVWMLLSVVF
jgi:hypothetical protein